MAAVTEQQLIKYEGKGCPGYMNDKFMGTASFFIYIMEAEVADGQKAIVKFLEKKVNFYNFHPIYKIDVNDKYHYVT